MYDPDGSGVVGNLSWDAHLRGYAAASNGGRAWPYMQCVDGSGHMQTCDADRGCIFSAKYAALPFWSDVCSAAFNVSAAQSAAAVAFNALNYGGNATGASRVLFVNGDIDPFHWGSVTRNTSGALARDVVALLVRGGSHCQDMGARSEADSAPMRLAKQLKAGWLANQLLGK